MKPTGDSRVNMRRPRCAVLAAVLSFVAVFLLVSCVDPGVPDTTTTASTTTSTTMPEGAIMVTSRCAATPVAPFEDGAIRLVFSDLTPEQRNFAASSIKIDVAWSGAPNDDLALGLVGSAEGFVGLTAGGAESGGAVSFTDEADVLVTDLPSADGRGLVGVGRPLDPLAGLAGEPLGEAWTLAAVNLSESVAAEIESCELTVVAAP